MAPLASIKPRIEIRGNARALPLLARSPPRFNKAANRNSRKLDFCAPTIRENEASIKPRIEIRGNAAVRMLFPKSMGASIKPRIEIRGNFKDAFIDCPFFHASIKPRIEIRGNCFILENHGSHGRPLQ